MSPLTDPTVDLMLVPSLSFAQQQYLRAFAETRRMRRKEKLTATRADPLREAVGLPVGSQGGYFVGESGAMGEDISVDVLAHNEPPDGQPSAWCPWTVAHDGTRLVLANAVAKEEAIGWLQYLISHFFTPWGCAVTGEMTWPTHTDQDDAVLVINNIIALPSTTIFSR